MSAPDVPIGSSWTDDEGRDVEVSGLRVYPTGLHTVRYRRDGGHFESSVDFFCQHHQSAI